AYLAAQDVADEFELYAAPLTVPESSVKVSAITAVGPVLGDVLAYRETPDGRRAVYCADQDTNDVFELFSVTTDGRGKPVKLNGPLVFQGRVDPDTLAISPDGAWTVFRADAHLAGAQELFSRRCDGSGPLVQLSGAIVANAGPVAVAAFSPD